MRRWLRLTSEKNNCFETNINQNVSSMKKQITIITFVLLGVYLQAFSQPASEGNVLRLSVEQAREHAIQHNRTVQNAGLSVSEAQRRTWEVISAGLPQVSASIDYQNLMGFNMSLMGMDIAMAPTSNLNIRATQLIFSASYWVGIKMSRIGEELTETARQQAEQDIRHQTQSAYYGVLVAQENRAILEHNLQNLETIARTTGDLVRIGVAQQTDADQIQLQVLTMRNVIKSIDRNIELAYNLLRFLLGVDSQTQIVLTQTLEDILASKNPNQVLATNFDVSNNHTMQLLEGQVDLANMQINLERASTLPTVAAFYNHTHKIAASAFDMTPNNVIGMQVSIPIFASGQRHARTQQAKINLEKAQNNRDMFVESLLLQEKQLRFNLNNAVDAFELQKEAMDVAQRVFESITRKYQHGTASSLDVTTSNTNLLQTQANYINAMINVFTAQLELEKLLNTL
jgi:outer membrane protein TolC